MELLHHRLETTDPYHLSLLAALSLRPQFHRPAAATDPRTLEIPNQILLVRLVYYFPLGFTEAQATRAFFSHDLLKSSTNFENLSWH
jgi:hypothetical protein